jgi:hypothetical protein
MLLALAVRTQVAGGEDLNVAVIIPPIILPRLRKSTHRGPSNKKLSDNPDKNALVKGRFGLERRTQARLLK